LIPSADRRERADAWVSVTSGVEWSNHCWTVVGTVVGTRCSFRAVNLLAVDLEVTSRTSGGSCVSSCDLVEIRGWTVEFPRENREGTRRSPVPELCVGPCDVKEVVVKEDIVKVCGCEMYRFEECCKALLSRR